MNKSVLSGIPLFSGIDSAELEEFARIFQTVTFAAGTPLVRQGQPADSALIIESGTADAVTALPGGGELTLAALGPGSMLGEMALLESGVRAATVIARTPVSAFFIERDGFRALIAQRDRAAFTIQNRITRTLCRRLHELNGKIAAHDAPDTPAPAMAEHVAPSARRGRPSFDYKAFLPVLPVFRRFSPAEIEELAGLASAMELGRGQVLFRQGEASGSCYIVVRGAVEIASGGNGRRHRIGILGPGRLCGILALIEGQPHSMSASAREDATLLELAKPAFDRLFNGDDRVAARFQDAINRELLQSLARTVNHLTRLVSQARIRVGGQAQKSAEELQRALGSRDCRAA